MGVLVKGIFSFDCIIVWIYKRFCFSELECLKISDFELLLFVNGLEFFLVIYMIVFFEVNFLMVWCFIFFIILVVSLVVVFYLWIILFFFRFLFVILVGEGFL